MDCFEFEVHRVFLSSCFWSHSEDVLGHSDPSRLAISGADTGHPVEKGLSLHLDRLQDTVPSPLLLRFVLASDFNCTVVLIWGSLSGTCRWVSTNYTWLPSK